MERIEITRGTRPSNGHLADRSFKDLTRDFVGEGQRLFREEVRLARAEIQAEARSAASGAAMSGAGGAILYGGVLALIFCVAAALATAWPVWLALLVTGIAFVLIGALVVVGGASRLRQTKQPIPETRSSLEEDRRWASETMRAVRSRTRANA